MKKIGRELNDAIENKKFDVARYILEIYVKRQYDINDTRDARYNQPLLARLLNDHYADLAKLAILAKADVNAKGCTGRSVLEMAAANGYKDIVELLISKGANVNSENEKDPPLSSAAKGGYKDIVDILLKTGADANAVNEYGHTPLMAAAMNNDIEIMDKLISFGADINAKDKMGRGAIFYAI
jgi:ankyrin repeat protein